MIKKIMALFLISVLFSTPCLLYANAQQKTKETPGAAIFVMAIPNEVRIEDQQSIYTEDYLHIEVHYPKIEGLLDKKFQKKINEDFESHAMQLQKEIKKEAQRQYKEQPSDQPLCCYELISNYTTKESLSDYLVIEFVDYFYTGGAHGLSQQKYITLDLQKNKIVSLNELFDDGVNYSTQLKQLIINQIKQQTNHEKYFFDDFYDRIVIRENQNFYINANGDLVLIFNVYEIAPYSTGVVHFTLKKDELKGYLLN